MDILACPICKHYPLELHTFRGEEEVTEGLIVCNKCKRWYPIIEEIPYMLPDELRDGKEDIAFMRKWRRDFPKEVLEEGEPYNQDDA